MLKRHEDALMQRIDTLTETGWASINWWELRQWYGMERITKKIYRDLRDRFLEENEGELHIYYGDEALLLIHNDRLSTMSEKLEETAED